MSNPTYKFINSKTNPLIMNIRPLLPALLFDALAFLFLYLGYGHYSTAEELATKGATTETLKSEEQLYLIYFAIAGACFVIAAIILSLWAKRRKKEMLKQDSQESNYKQ